MLSSGVADQIKSILHLNILEGTGRLAQFNNGSLPRTNGLNNSTYRAITMSAGGTSPTFSGNSVVRVPPLQAWRDNDSSVNCTTK